jgi:broad specificity phosphatase PhoE
MAGRLYLVRHGQAVGNDGGRYIDWSDPPLTIADRLGLPLEVTPALRELHFGEWDGLTPDEVYSRNRERYDRWLQDPEGEAPPGGERLSDLRSRLLTVLPAACALLVTHGGPVRMMLALLNGRPFWSYQVPTGSAWVVERGQSRLLES